MALEILMIGQHGEARGAACRIGAGMGGRIEIGADQALGRAGLLDLGDQAIAALGDLAAQRRGEAARAPA